MLLVFDHADYTLIRDALHHRMLLYEDEYRALLQKIETDSRYSESEFYRVKVGVLEQRIASLSRYLDMLQLQRNLFK